MLNVKPRLLQSLDNGHLEELQQLYLLGLTKSTEPNSQRRYGTSTFHTPAERQAALITTSLAGQDIPLIINPF